MTTDIFAGPLSKSTAMSNIPENHIFDLDLIPEMIL